jgi:dTDP-N-acetylfucosamine:lipid II N-acetylfucosaminyltransferase
MKILHISSNEKVMGPFMKLIKDNFDYKKHFYIIKGGYSTEKMPIPLKENILLLRSKRDLFLNLFNILNLLKNSEKIVLHGLFDYSFILLLSIYRKILDKCYWIAWGGDLYHYKLRKKNLKSEFFESRRRIIIKNIGHIVTGTKGDYLLAVKWYNAKGIHHKCFNYPSNVFSVNEIKAKNDNTINILVGNSADPSNNHFEIFDKLRPFKKNNIRIVVPLSYGSNRVYAEQVVSEGQKQFGNSFEALLKFLPPESYIELLGNIDIAIFNHKRQQGLGNLIQLIGLGKKVYLDKTSTLNGVFEEYGMIVYDVGKIDMNLIEKDIALNNTQMVRKHFSEASLLKSLKSWLE